MKETSTNMQQFKAIFDDKILPEEPSLSLKKLRERELNAFLAYNYPDRHQENLKYTNVAALAQQSFVIAKKDKVASEFVKRYKISDCYALTVNGYFLEESSVL